MPERLRRTTLRIAAVLALASAAVFIMPYASAHSQEIDIQPKTCGCKITCATGSCTCVGKWGSCVCQCEWFVKPDCRCLG